MRLHRPLVEAHFLASGALASPPTDGAFVQSSPVGNVTFCGACDSQLCAMHGASAVPPAPLFSCHPLKVMVGLFQHCLAPQSSDLIIHYEVLDLSEPLTPMFPFPCGLQAVAFPARSTV